MAFEATTITAADTAVGIDEYEGEYTLTLLGGNNEDNVDIVGSLEDIEYLLTTAIREIHKEMKVR